MSQVSGQVDEEIHWFWTESFWLPEGSSWKDLEPTEKVPKANLNDLYFIPLFVVLITVFRFLFERFLAKPFCIFLGIKDKSCERNKICELVYDTVTKYPKSKEYEAIAKETKMTPGEVNTWFRKRRADSKNTKMNKATETCWRAFVYLFLFLYGSVILWPTDWFMDHSKWYPGFVKEHAFTPTLKAYYFIEITFYFSLLFSQFYDTKRKDFTQQFIHHVTTLTMLLGSYTISLYRFGAVIMYIHDTADFWLEAAKLTNYAKKQKVCDVLFGIFALLFFLTRVVYYPGWVAYGFFHYAEGRIGIVFNTMVCLGFVLLFLNFYWGYLVLRLAYKVLFKGNGAKDSRSDTEESDPEGED